MFSPEVSRYQKSPVYLVPAAAISFKRFIPAIEKKLELEKGNYCGRNAETVQGRSVAPAMLKEVKKIVVQES
jgi:hypothetical protein